MTPPWVRLARWAGVVSVVMLSALWLVFTRKAIAVPAFVVFATLLGAAAPGTARRPARAAFAVFLFASLSPLDVTFRNVEGPPRIVRYAMGLPTPAMLERAKRGDVVLGGCLIRGFEPLWVVVW